MMTMTAVWERACEHCGGPVTGRADKRFCCDACRNTAHRVISRSDPIRSAATASPVPGHVAHSEPRQPHQTAEPCPDCGAALMASPCGTWRACLACRAAVVPAAVSAPYKHGGRDDGRQVVSQRDRDLTAISLARRKGVMLSQLAALAGGDRLHPESLPVVEWFSEQVKAAAGDARLDELAALLPESGIRQRRWWQPQPATAIDAAAWDDDDQDDDDPGWQPGHAITSPAAVRAVLTWADAADALGWRITATPGGCQVASPDGLCGADVRHHIQARHQLAWVCGHHYQAACRVIREAERKQA